MTDIVNRRQLGLMLAAGVTSLSAGSVEATAEELAVNAGTGAMSGDVQAKIMGFLLKQQMARQANVGPVSGPNPDPEYWEFWAEARPKDPPPPPTEAELIPDPNCPPASNPWAGFKQLYQQTPSWSEDAFFEIKPDFADMYPPLPPTGGDGPDSNSIFTMNLVQNGQPITDPEFYRGILRSLDKK